MPIDMSQFYQVFFEEVAEHLESMESQLLSLDLESPEPDQLNAIFRAAHSIKGSSSTFGFVDMTELMHELEALLDRVRKCKLPITTEIVDAALKAGDVLRVLLQAHRDGGITDLAVTTEIRDRLRGLASQSHANGAAQPAHTTHGAQSIVSDDNRSSKIYQIQFANTPTAFPSKTHLDNLIAELGKLGRIESQSITSVKVTLTLASAAEKAALIEIFSYFLEPSQLSISVSEEATRAEGDAQGYGFFVASETLPVNVDATDETAQGYGFFVTPEVIQETQEAQQGYGFFVAPEALQANVDNNQGYGFFHDISPPVRVADTKIYEEMIPQRRASDRPLGESGGDASIRVSVAKIDKLVNLVGELVITQAMMAETISRMDPVLNETLLNGLAQFERNTRDLQESIMSVRMIPINVIFSRFPRLVRDFAAKFDKQVQLKTIGESTELDRGLIEKISDPLTHLVRNSLDHGIEFSADRIAKGKNPQGTITLRAAHQGGNIVIAVADDGAGLDRGRILFKAKEKGLPVSDDMSDAEVWQIIFAPGFSTATMVTDVSGRGVGMDVVKRNIESIGGRVEVQSVQGQGMTTTIRLPLTLAILDGLSVTVGGQIYIIPLGFISESLQPAASDIKEISGQKQVVHVRGEYVPIVALHQVFNIKTQITDPAQGILVLLEAEGKTVALFVDDLMGQHQVVIKSLETNYRKITGISGATIMGDGRVAMIIDVGELVGRMAGN